MEGRDLRGREVSCECVCLGTTLPVFFVVVVVFGGAIIVHAFGLKMLSVFFCALLLHHFLCHFNFNEGKQIFFHSQNHFANLRVTAFVVHVCSTDRSACCFCLVSNKSFICFSVSLLQ